MDTAFNIVDGESWYPYLQASLLARSMPHGTCGLCCVKPPANRVRNDRKLLRGLGDSSYFRRSSGHRLQLHRCSRRRQELWVGRQRPRQARVPMVGRRHGSCMSSAGNSERGRTRLADHVRNRYELLRPHLPISVLWLLNCQFIRDAGFGCPGAIYRRYGFALPYLIAALDPRHPCDRHLRPA